MIIAGVVQTTEGTPVAGAHVAAVLITETESTPSTGGCRGIPGPHGEGTSSAIGKFTIPIQMPGPQSAVCLLVKVDAPEGSGLRDTTVSGPRFWYGIPPTTTIPTEHVTVVLSKG